MTTPIRVAVTGAAVQIGYSLIFRIAAGEALAADSRSFWHLTEIPPAMGAIFTWSSTTARSPRWRASSRPTAITSIRLQRRQLRRLRRQHSRKQGMERADLIRINWTDLHHTGAATPKRLPPDVRVLVVGNPCNTNCSIAMNNA